MATIKRTLPPKDEQKPVNSALKKFLKDARHYNDVIPEELVISSGSLTLDATFKVRTGMVLRLVGKGAELGKTAQSFVFMDSYLKTIPKSKGLYIKAEGRLSRAKLEKAGLKFVYELEEWVEGTVFVVCSNVAEPIFDMLKNTLEEAHEAGEHVAWIIDSMDGLILQDDLAKGITNGSMMVAGVPKLTKLLFRHIALPTAHYDSLGIITGQYAAQIKIDTYAPTSPNQGSSSNGSSAQHQADYVFEYQPVNQGDLILEDAGGKPDVLKNKILGKFARIKILKSADDVTGGVYTVPIRRGEEYKGASQIWKSKEVADMLIQYEMIKKGGAWLTFEEDVLASAKEAGFEVQAKINGINQFYDYLEENKDIMEYFYNKILALIQQ